MKKFTKVLAIILVLAMLAPSVAAATIDPVQPLASSYLSSYSASLDFSGSTITTYFRVYGTGTMAEIGVKGIILQASTDQKIWTNVAVYNYTNSQYSDLMMAYNRLYFNSSVSYSGGISGYYYRAKVTVWAGDGTNGDYRVFYTDVKQL